jgi:uncharacterized protein YqfB (UPF0267 family)
MRQSTDQFETQHTYTGEEVRVLRKENKWIIHPIEISAYSPIILNELNIQHICEQAVFQRRARIRQSPIILNKIKKTLFQRMYNNIIGTQLP